MDVERARHLADGLRAARLARRRAEAEELRLITQLACGYHLEAESDAHDALYEQDEPVGGDGCPLVSEWLSLELAALLGCTSRQATSLIGRALNLRYRHPRLWTAVQQVELDPHRAAAAAARCESLPPDVADEVGVRWAAAQHRLSWGAAMNLMDRLIIEAAPEIAAERERRTLNGRYVSISRYREGSMQVSAQLDVLDAKYLEAAVSQISGLLVDDGAAAGCDADQVRAKALGVLANPAYALALQQRAAMQPRLVEERAPGRSPIGGDEPEPDPMDGERRPHPADCAGHVCGTITVPLTQLRPATDVVVHIPATAVEGLAGGARVERAGWLTMETLKDLLGDRKVAVRPVIDLPEIPAEDPYRPSARLREAVIQLFPTEAFPYSETESRGLEQDHTRAFRTGPPRQSRIGNLAPLRTRTHRAKTAGHWRYDQPAPGCLIWRSPLGYRYRVTPHGTYPLN
ncbi:hypothetical protein TESS_TESS_02692 [Tessaracoccus sp. O5.2]|uniref:hypothetical protein n=1 Tax=Tessaracoccus sp. O5.2 TaxID=3157622 RepID=UPI0035F076BE